MQHASVLFDRLILTSTALIAAAAILMSVQTMASAQAFERIHAYSCNTDSECAAECLAFEPASDCSGNRVDRAVASVGGAK